MRYLCASMMFLAIGAMSSIAAAQTSCSLEKYERANASLEAAAGGWRPLMRHWQAFAPCDDGALAEGYSDAVVSLLAKRWDEFRVFVALSNREPAFERWAIGHIDASASSEDLKTIMRNAASCDGNVQKKALCKKVRRAATDATADSTR
jgi:hypothetical protein